MGSVSVLSLAWSWRKADGGRVMLRGMGWEAFGY